jgi:carbon-monoxide dehydrogenase medium subunit
MGVAHWPHLVDVKQIPDLRGIGLEAGTLRIGAAVTHLDLEVDPVIAAAIPALAELEGNIANVRVRAAGTLAGNLCFGEPHADPPALLMALGATLEIAGRTARRTLPVDEFLTGAYSNALREDEIVVAINVPVPASDVRAAYLNFRVLERPSVGVAVVGAVGGGRFRTPPAVVVGAADEVPRRVDAPMLAGAGAESREALFALAEAAAAAVAPVDDLAGTAEFKRHLVGVIARRAAAKALAA